MAYPSNYGAHGAFCIAARFIGRDDASQLKISRLQERLPAASIKSIRGKTPHQPLCVKA